MDPLKYSDYDTVEILVSTEVREWFRLNVKHASETDIKEEIDEHIAEFKHVLAMQDWEFDDLTLTMCMAPMSPSGLPCMLYVLIHPDKTVHFVEDILGGAYEDWAFEFTTPLPFATPAVSGKCFITCVRGPSGLYEYSLVFHESDAQGILNTTLCPINPRSLLTFRTFSNCNEKNKSFTKTLRRISFGSLVLCAKCVFWA